MISDEEYRAESTPAAADGRSAGTVVARPALFGRLGELARVTAVSASAGSGKTVLLRSWIAEAIGSRLGVPAVSVPADVLMLPGYFGFFAYPVTLDLSASTLITRRTIGWEPAQPSLLADLDNGHYFFAN